MKSFALTFASALLVAQPLLAADRHAWRIGDDSVHLYYGDLDMNTAAGRAEMLARVEHQARRLCEAPLKVDEEECVAVTVEKAAAGQGGQSLQLALKEREQVRMARR